MSNHSATFTRPPVDGMLTIDQMYDWHRIHSPDFSAFVYPNENIVDGREDQSVHLTWKQLGEGISRSVQIIHNYIPEVRSGDNASPQQDPIVVGILATSDIITYTTFLFSLLRLTHPVSGRALLPFPISTRNSPAAVAHLAHITGVKYLWVTEGPMKNIVDEALRNGGLEDATILQIPSFSDFYPVGSPSNSTYSPDDYRHNPVPLDRPALILHSSGSSAFPKPRTLTHQILLDWSPVFEHGNLDVLGQTMAVHGSPIFHGMGILTVTWAAASGFIRAVPSPRVTSPPLTPELLLDQITKSKSTLLFCVPSFLEAWSKEPRSIEILAKLKAIFWGGAPLQPDVGQFLLKEGVLIHNFYGATEFGLSNFVSATPYPEGYEWFKFAPYVSPAFLEEDEQGISELVFKQCATHHLSVLNTDIGGVPAYATSDLVEQHPSKPELFRVRGRKDDQIMLSTGEKTNPGPLESIIVKNPHVKNAIIFGRGRTSNGILIEPTSHEEAQKQGVEAFRNLIWPSIEEANEYAPAHSRIFKEMILVASPSKPFTYTVKRNLRRNPILSDYAPEIEVIYNAVQESSQMDIPVPAGTSDAGGWTSEESMGFVRKVVNTVITSAKEMDDDDDLFGHGCDSLQATYIRNSLLHALRQVAPPANVQKVSSNVVYQHPTIRSLASYVAEVSHSKAASGEVDIEAARIKRLDAMVTKYTQNWPTHYPSMDDVDQASETILLTGSTGGLGSQLLEQLVAMPSVRTVYAFNRLARDGKSSLERHHDAFLDRGNDVALLNSKKIVFVEGDTSQKDFGIDPSLFNKIRDSVTTIIHNAWRVDFNIALPSFEPAVRGVRFLIDLALQSPHRFPPRVMFTSSIGNVKAWSDIPPVYEGPLVDMGLINTSGYSESKWVSERILTIAGQDTVLRPIIARVGQLCGGINGNWGSREWFPALVRAGQVVGGVPDNHGLMSFLPLHVAASALIELRHTSNQFIHLVHPRPVPWRTAIQHIADMLRVPVIPYDEWMGRLEASPTTDEDLHRNPALHLIGFYRACATPRGADYTEAREAMGLAMYETQNTVADASCLGPERLPPLGKEDIGRWVSYWRSKGALDC